MQLAAQCIWPDYFLAHYASGICRTCKKNKYWSFIWVTRRQDLDRYDGPDGRIFRSQKKLLKLGACIRRKTRKITSQCPIRLVEEGGNWKPFY